MDVRQILRKLPYHSDVYGSRAWVHDPNHYPIYAKVFEVLSPRTLYEIGAFIGYSLATAAVALPDLELIAWVDDESGLAHSNQYTEENVLAARAASGHKSLRLIYHTAEIPGVKPGEFDVIHIDGDHRYEPFTKDLNWAVARKPRYVIGHDVALSGAGVHNALFNFYHENQPGGFVEVYLTNGLFVVPYRESLEDCYERLVKAGVDCEIVRCAD